METSTSRESHGRPAIEFCCAKCSKIVQICQCCWRNDKYCSDECSHQATLERHRHNQKTYRMTEAGRAKHIAQQKAYRARKKIQEWSTSKSRKKFCKSFFGWEYLRCLRHESLRGRDFEPSAAEFLFDSEDLVILAPETQAKILTLYYSEKRSMESISRELGIWPAGSFCTTTNVND